jgi:hypothetical protein
LLDSKWVAGKRVVSVLAMHPTWTVRARLPLAGTVWLTADRRDGATFLCPQAGTQVRPGANIWSAGAIVATAHPRSFVCCLQGPLFTHASAHAAPIASSKQQNKMLGLCVVWANFVRYPAPTQPLFAGISTSSGGDLGEQTVRFGVYILVTHCHSDGSLTNRESVQRMQHCMKLVRNSSQHNLQRRVALMRTCGCLSLPSHARRCELVQGRCCRTVE